MLDAGAGRQKRLNITGYATIIQQIIGACLVSTSIDRKRSALKNMADALDKENADYIEVVDSFIRAPKRVLQIYKNNFASTIDMYKNQLSYLLPKEPSAEMLMVVLDYNASVGGLVRRNLDKIDLHGNIAELPKVYAAYKLFASGVHDDLYKKTGELISNLQKMVMLRQNQ